MESCDECGLVYADIPRREISSRLRDFGERYAAALSATPIVSLRAHPSEGVWSALEYGCHVRDMLQVQRERVMRARVEERPRFEPMGREERVVDLHYNAQPPAEVASDLALAASLLAATFDEFGEAEWLRTCVYTWPSEQVRTLEWVGRHTVHECLHHLMDFDRQVAASGP